MRKSRIYIGMAAVSVLLIILIGIQLLWMRRANAIERRDMRMHVIRALEQTEEQLRNTNYCLITYSKLFINPHEGFYMVHQKHDSTGFHGPVDTVHMLSNDEAFTQSDTVLFDIGSMFTGHYPVSADMQLRFRMAVKDTADFYRQQKEFYNNTGSKRVSDRIANTQAIDSLFDMNLADSLLGANLKAMRVPVEFGFGFVSSSENRVVYARRVKDSSRLFGSPYAINIFTDNKFLKPHKLAIVFPTLPGNYGLNYWLTLSIAIILLLTVSLYAFVRRYVTQVRLSEMKSDFINNLTHEFNTPIANISLALETLGENASGDDKVRKILGIIATESERLRDNIDKALSAAAMDRGEIHLHKENIDLVAVIKTILTTYRLQCEQLGGRIDFTHPEEIHVNADETHLLNCVCNLLDNSIKYRQGAPVINISLKTEAKFATLVVTDNGKGMNSETLKHIFEKFYRAHEGDVHNTKGFGLGLSYVKGIIDAHNGKTSVLSKPGAGTTFTIYLPK